MLSRTNGFRYLQAYLLQVPVEAANRLESIDTTGGRYEKVRSISGATGEAKLLTKSLF
jgi:hypothetical protein